MRARVAVDAEQQAAEAPPAVDRDRHLDLDLVAGIALEIRAPHQRPVDAGRRHFEPIGAIDRVGDVEHRRQRARDGLAVLDRHGAVRPLGHDLDGAAGEPGNPDPDQAVAEAGEHRLDDGGNAGRHALLDDQARLGVRRVVRSLRVIRSSFGDTTLGFQQFRRPHFGLGPSR